MTKDSTVAFDAYLRARDAVITMKGEQRAGVAPSEPSAYWTEELEHIDYLLEASPLIVRKLRHHAFHITGIRPYDYRDRGDGRIEQFTARLRTLQALGGDELLVPEAPNLGGFGFEIDGHLYNVDTLKFYEVVIGMKRGGILEWLRSRTSPVVCEIGAGWAGFARQFKTLLPGATYVIVDFPELFLFSASYLGALFPEARLLFCTGPDETALEGWREADFVFVPHTRADLVRSLSLDLTVNMVSFQEMTEAQVHGYARLAAEAGCLWLYSLNRERSPYNTELVSVSAALGDYYDLADVRVLDTDYTSALRKAPKANRTSAPSPLGYRHKVGRLASFRRSPRVPDGKAASVAGSSQETYRSPRVVLGMTLYNNAGYLREALDSLLGQTWEDFRLVLLDDASTDATEAIGREYAARDDRVQYERHSSRQAMIATWRDVVELGARAYPSAPYFAWVSDHDRWHPEWLARLVAALDADPKAVLAYPITRRIGPAGEVLAKGARRFDTTEVGGDRRARWTHFCRYGIGAGDMVYGLMRRSALLRAGIFRQVLRPDRLLIAELTLQGTITQVPEVLWDRRQASADSVIRQPQTLVRAGHEPAGFHAPPWWQHARVLWREYVARTPRPLPITRAEWCGMLLQFQTVFAWRHARYGWRHSRHNWILNAIGNAIDASRWLIKRAKRGIRLAVFHALVEGRWLWRKSTRLVRRQLFEANKSRRRVGRRLVDSVWWIWKRTRHGYHQVIFHAAVSRRRVWAAFRRAPKSSSR